MSNFGHLQMVYAWNEAAVKLSETLDRRAEHYHRAADYKKMFEHYSLAELLNPQSQRQKIISNALSSSKGAILSHDFYSPMEEQVENNKNITPSPMQSHQGVAVDDVVNWENASASLEKAREFRERGDLLDAYREYKKLEALLKSAPTQPSFYAVAMEEKEKIASILIEKISPKILEIEKQWEAPNANIKKMGETLEPWKSVYPPSVKLEELLKKIYAHFQTKAESIFLKAKTLHDLEGCPAAKSDLIQAKQRAHFPSVQIWKEADEMLKRCE